MRYTVQFLGKPAQVGVAPFFETFEIEASSVADALSAGINDAEDRLAGGCREVVILDADGNAVARWPMP